MGTTVRVLSGPGSILKPDAPVRVTIRHPDGSTVEFETDKPVTITAAPACHSLLADIALPLEPERNAGRPPLTVIEGGKR